MNNERSSRISRWLGVLLALVSIFYAGVGRAGISYLDLHITALNFPGGRTIYIGDIGAFVTVGGQSSYRFNGTFAAESGSHGLLRDAINSSISGSSIVTQGCATNFACTEPLYLSISYTGSNGTNALQTMTASVCINIFNAHTNLHTYRVIRTDTGGQVGNSVAVPAGSSARFCFTFSDGPHDLQAIDEGGRVIASVSATDGRWGLSNGDGLTRLQGSDVGSIDGGGSTGSQAGDVANTNDATSGDIKQLHMDFEDLQLMLAFWSNRNELLHADLTNSIAKASTNGGKVWTNGLTIEQLMAEHSKGSNTDHVNTAAQSAAGVSAGSGGSASISNLSSITAGTLSGSSAANVPWTVTVGGVSVDLNPLNLTGMATMAAWVRLLMTWLVTVSYLMLLAKYADEWVWAAASAQQAKASGQSVLGTNLNTPVALAMAAVITIAVAVIPAFVVSWISPIKSGLATSLGSSDSIVGKCILLMNAFLPLDLMLGNLIGAVSFKLAGSSVFFGVSTAVRFLVGAVVFAVFTISADARTITITNGAPSSCAIVSPAGTVGLPSWTNTLTLPIGDGPLILTRFGNAAYAYDGTNNIGLDRADLAAVGWDKMRVYAGFGFGLLIFGAMWGRRLLGRAVEVYTE